MNFHLQNIKNQFPLLLGISIFIYLILRVFLMPISDDEFITVDLHASQSWWGVLTTGNPNIDWAPNNHVLNTLFMKLEILIFGRKDWAVRLHILLSFLVCYYFVFKTIQYFTESSIRQTLYLLIIFFNPYLLDFFGLARGYAMSIAAYSAAFYYLVRYSNTLKESDLKYIYISLFFAVWSNLSALYYLLLFPIIIAYIIYINRKEINIKNHCLIPFISSLLILVIILFPLIKTLKSPDTFGGKIGIFQDCIVSYLNQFIHHNESIDRHKRLNENWKYTEIYSIILFVLWLILNLISLLFQSSLKIIKVQKFSFFLLIGVAILAKILFILLKVPYPMNRTLLLFSFPFFIGICAAFERIIVQKKAFLLPLCFVIIGLFWHFSNAVTFENTIEWWQNGDAKNLVSYMKEEFKNNPPNGKVKFGVEGWQYHSLAFYTEIEFKDQMELIWTDLSNNDRHFDYVFIPNHQKDKVWKEYVPIKIFKRCTLFKLSK